MSLLFAFDVLILKAAIETPSLHGKKNTSKVAGYLERLQYH